MMKSLLSFALSALILSKDAVEAFYLPGVNPTSFKEGDPVALKVNKITSTKTLMPVDYYRLPFCKPLDGVQTKNENLGELLRGDRIENSPYQLFMKQDMYCEQLCTSNGGRTERKGVSNNKLIRAIKKGYQHNWIVDNLPAAGRISDDGEPLYFQGFPIGFVDENNGQTYVNNHVNIEIQYHAVETQQDSYRIVKFIVEPISIHHEFSDDFELDDDDEEEEEETDGGDEGTKPKKRVELQNPIASCDPRNKKLHTTDAMLKQGTHTNQLAGDDILFTYDVIWKENKELHWASRWDVYLSMNNMVKPSVHWYAITESLIVVIVLTFMIFGILVRNLRRDFTRYNKLATDEEKAEDMEEFGWKLVHADVFRPPKYPMTIAIATGTGAQIIGMTLLTIVFSAVGFLNPSSRGSLLMAILALYVLLGSVNGYITARLYKTFKGKAWQRATTTAAIAFPGLCFVIFIAMNILAFANNSTDAVPFTAIFLLIVLWFGISTPLVFLGSYFAYKQDAIEYPVKTSNIPRQIPNQLWYLSPLVGFLVAGILPFGSCFVELYFIFSSLWMDQYYYVFGFLLLVFMILVITTCEITLLFNYFHLCAEDYRWWWRSFATGASVGFYIFGYSISYFRNLHSNSFSSYMLYFGYMLLSSFAIGLMTGAVGVLSCFWFNLTIFGSIKVD